MSRRITKNTSNRGQLGLAAIGPLINGAGEVSVSAWIRPASFSAGATDNAIFAVWMTGGVGGLLLTVDGSGSSPVLRASGRSTSSDSLQALSGSIPLLLGDWIHVGAVFDYVNATIETRVGGVRDTLGSVTWWQTKYTHSAAANPQDQIGLATTTPPGSTATQFDGDIAEVCVLSCRPSNNQWNAIAESRHSPLLRSHIGLPLVESELLRQHCRFYHRLLGVQATEYDMITSIPFTITGTINGADHPSIVEHEIGFNRDMFMPSMVPSAGAAKGTVFRSPVIRGGLGGIGNSAVIGF